METTMQPNLRFWHHKRVCVTGGTGFLGWHLVRLLLPLAGQVRILGLKPKSPTLVKLLHRLDCVHADIRDTAAVRDAVADCDVVFHAAGTVGVWGPALAQMHEIHSLGTQNVLQALPSHARMVHTSSIAAIGASRDRAPLTETSPFQLQHLNVDYVHAKKASEDLVLAAAERGADVLAVNPAYLIGPDDHEVSIMGQFCLRVWKGKVPLIPPGGLNFADVRDVALGHLLAAERGAAGRRYILGGENLLITEFVQALAQVRGISSRRWLRMPRWLYGLLACGGALRAQVTGHEPYPSLQHWRVSRYYWHYSSERARMELGYAVRPVLDTLREMHEWYCRTGLLRRIASHEPCSESRRDERKAA
jgi:dihydroflavonol-4-reductase